LLLVSLTAAATITVGAVPALQPGAAAAAAPGCGSTASPRSSRSGKTRRNTAATAVHRRPPALDPGRCKQRNTVERCFSKLKQFRAVVTRYDCERIYQGTIDVASISIGLRDPVP
jgi:transposase